jgi:hypothetical protein
MKSLSSLPSDIYALLENGVEVDDAKLDQFAARMRELLKRRLQKRDDKGGLRMSNVGTPCDRKLWYTVNEPQSGEALEGKTLLKFLYGDVVEELVLFLAEVDGHTVEGMQERLEVNGVVGHRDAIIDGVLVDVKSASSFGMEKFRKHRLETDDPFGYLDQLNLYLEASRDDPRVLVKGQAAFIAVGKETGEIVVDVYKKSEEDYHGIIQEKKDMVGSERVPNRRYFPQADGASGNQKLGTECSYCPFKERCWPGLRTFIYSNGPRYLTQVKRVPDVPEASKLK